MLNQAIDHSVPSGCRTMLLIHGDDYLLGFIFPTPRNG